MTSGTDAPARWESARVVVLGLARSGEAAARALLDRGATVTVVDERGGDAQRERAARLTGAHVVLEATDPTVVHSADLVVASPGFAPHSMWMRAATQAGVRVWSEVELAFRLGARVAVAVTGTKGKTTTTEMATAALTRAGMPAVAAGNVGTPLVDVLDADRIVAEVSSFQLYAIDAFTAPVAMMLNIAPDHLDWHGSFAEYVRAKVRVFETQSAGDVAVHHVSCAEYVRGVRARTVPFSEYERPAGGAGVEGGWIVVPEGRVVEVARMRATGRPNRAAAVAAAAAACASGADPHAVGEALADYEAQPHRMEHIAMIGGVSFINDSKATDPFAALAALEEMRDVVLIAGGRNKGLNMAELAEAAPRLRAVVAIGEASTEIAAAFVDTDVAVEHAGTMEEAVERAHAVARPGDTVLLAPACASTDMFGDYAARGEAFRAAVKHLKGDR